MSEGFDATSSNNDRVGSALGKILDGFGDIGGRLEVDVLSCADRFDKLALFRATINANDNAALGNGILNCEIDFGFRMIGLIAVGDWKYIPAK